MLTKQSEKPEQKKTRKEAKADRKRLSKENNTEETASTRQQQKKKRKQNKRSMKRPRRRVFPIWLRISVILLLAAAALIVGLMIGYGILGDGVPTDALKKETWQHIIDIVKKEE